VTVEGFFEGTTGRFYVERVGSFQRTTADAVRRCVALYLEGARVRPFTAPRHHARWTVANTVSPEIHAMLAAEARQGSTPGPDASGEIDAAAVERVLGAQREVFQRCYEFVARGDPTLRGVMTVRLTLSVDGRITQGTFAHDVAGLREVGHCVVGHLRTVSFPRAREAAVVYEFTLDFAPRDAERATDSTGSR
jgi:hypothetical protein